MFGLLPIEGSWFLRFEKLLKEFFRKSPRPSFLIKRAALGNLKASFHCTHWHRFFPLKRAPPLTPTLSPSGEREKTALQSYICPTCPSPAGGSLTHSQPLALSKRARDVTALRCSEPLRSKVGGPSKVFAMLCGMGPPGEGSLKLIVYSLQLIFGEFC